MSHKDSDVTHKGGAEALRGARPGEEGASAEYPGGQPPRLSTARLTLANTVCGSAIPLAAPGDSATRANTAATGSAPVAQPAGRSPPLKAAPATPREGRTPSD